MSESIILLVLGACWAGYLSWYWRENRRGTPQKSDGIRSFAAGLGTLGGSSTRSRQPGAAAPLTPRNAGEAARRRREVGMGLAVVAVVTLFAAVALGPAFWAIHIMVDLVGGVFAYASIQRRNITAEREMKVHMLYPDHQRQPVGARRAASG